MASRRSDARGEGAGLTRAQALDLCARLSTYGAAGAAPRDLLLKAGHEATRSFPDDVDVLVAAGRMYLMGEELAEAEVTLRNAARRAPKDAHTLRLLGEVKLRQGEPIAAHDALAAAVACGMSDPWTKTWMSRALDYSELIGDLGREGVAKDVLQVLGKPGQGPTAEDRSFAEVRAAKAPKTVTGRAASRIDKGIFFAGDPRAEAPESRARGWGMREGEVLDLPTPVPSDAGERRAMHAQSPSEEGYRSPTSSGERRVSRKASGMADALADDSAWGPPSSESMPGSDTEISAWAPEMQSVRRSAPPVKMAHERGAVERIAPLPPGMPRLSAGELFDEFTERRPTARPPEMVEARLSPFPAEDRPTRKGPPSFPAEDRPTRKGPPPLPPEAAPILPYSGDISGRSFEVKVVDADAEGPVTAPPSALIPIESRRARDIESRRHVVEPEPAAQAFSEPDQSSPPSLALPEPPSLQVPSALYRPAPDSEGAAQQRSSADVQGGASKPSAIKAARSRWQGAILRGLALVLLGALLAGGFEMYKRNRATKVRALAAQASVALHSGGPRGVADADAALNAARNIDPKSRLVIASTLRMLFFAVLDVDPRRVGELTAAMDRAASVGIRSSELAFASIARATVTGDGATATELIANFDEDPDRIGDPLYQLAAGVALEAQDPAASVERFRISVKLNGDVLSAQIRFVRALAHAGQVVEARERLAHVQQKWPNRAEISVLEAVIAAADPRPGQTVTLDPHIDVDMLPRSLRSVGRALTKPQDENEIARAVSDAEVAPVVILCGETALHAGFEATARDAAKRALEISPSYAPAFALLARVALSAGRFEEARQAALRAGSDVAAEILSLIAYENGEIAAMRAAAGKRAEQALTEPIAAGVARLAGVAPLSSTVLSALALSRRFWAEIIAMDGALDAGDLVLAQTIATHWPTAENHAVRAARIARMLRYQGKNGAAQTVATSSVPTVSARVEAALASAEMASNRTQAIETIRSGRSPDERWASAFLLAREGRVGPARLVVKDLAVPGQTAPLSVRVLAALALSELHMLGPTHPVARSLSVWTKNPDVAHALGLAPPVSAAPPTKPNETDAATPSAPSSSVAPPNPASTAPSQQEKPALKGRLPKKSDDDPY